MGFKSFFQNIFKKASDAPRYLNLATEVVETTRAAGFIDLVEANRLLGSLALAKAGAEALDAARKSLGVKSVTVGDRARVILRAVEDLQQAGATHIKSERARAEFLKYASLAHAAVAVFASN